MLLATMVFAVSIMTATVAGVAGKKVTGTLDCEVSERCDTAVQSSKMIAYFIIIKKVLFFMGKDFFQWTARVTV